MYPVRLTTKSCERNLKPKIREEGSSGIAKSKRMIPRESVLF
jgi:hypothetical protein